MNLYYKRALTVLRTEGFSSFVKRLALFIKDFFPNYGQYYLYEHNLIEWNENDFLPSLANMTCKIVESNQEADKLEEEGFEFRSTFLNARRNLDKGCIAICLFIEKGIANISWVAISEDAKLCIDPVPYQVKFDDREACFGDMFTLPKHRNKGLMAYSLFKQIQVGRQKGMQIARYAINVNNIASNKASSRFSPITYGTARNLTVFGMKFYKEY